MLQKRQEKAGRLRVCERQRNGFAIEGNKLFFVECDMSGSRQYKTVALSLMIKQLIWLESEK